MKTLAIAYVMILATDDVGSFIGGSWDKLTLTGALLIALVVIWRQAERRDSKKDELQAQLVQFQKERADQSAANAAGYAAVVSANTQATVALTTQVTSSNILLKELADELEKRSS
jgi:mannitol-1-phosphate/altronate dehydrogenase